MCEELAPERIEKPRAERGQYQQHHKLHHRSDTLSMSVRIEVVNPAIVEFQSAVAEYADRQKSEEKKHLYEHSDIRKYGYNSQSQARENEPICL